MRVFAGEHMRHPVIVVTALSLVAGAARGQAIPRNFSLYTDKKAMQLEDVITVIIEEDAKATNDTKTNTDKSQDAKVAINPMNIAWNGGAADDITPKIGFGGGVSQKYNGEGKTSRAG